MNLVTVLLNKSQLMSDYEIPVPSDMNLISLSITSPQKISDEEISTVAFLAIQSVRRPDQFEESRSYLDGRRVTFSIKTVGGTITYPK